MPDPTTDLTFEPADPTPIVDGVLVTVTGPVKRAKIVLKTADGAIHQASPEFGMSNMSGEHVVSEVETIDIQGDPTGGTFDLAAYDYADGESLPTAAGIPFDADTSDMITALGKAWGFTNVAVTGSDPFRVEFINFLNRRRIAITADDSDLVSGNVVVAEVTQGGAVGAGGPYQWGPIYLPDVSPVLADVISTVDDDEHSIYEGDSLLDEPVYIFE